MKKLSVFLALIIVLLSIAGCSRQRTVVFPDPDNNNSSISATMRSTDIPTSLEDMKDKAENIVLCTVTRDDESETYESGLTVSYADVTVENVIKGDTQVGDVLKIAETGERREKNDGSIDGVPLLRKDMHVILFLLGRSEAGRYGIVANYYGKLFIDGDETVYPPSYFSSRAGTIPDFTEPMPLEELLKLL